MMASGRSTVPVVLRVKRKRSEEPADILVVTTKVAKLDPLLSEKDQKLFHFAGTVQNQLQSRREVLAHVSEHRNHSSMVKLNAFTNLTISQQQEDRREARKDLTSSRRFRLISKLRSLEGNEVSTLSDKTKEDNLDLKKSELVHVYDLEDDPNEPSPPKHDPSELKHSDSELMQSGSSCNKDTDMENNGSVITCNSSPMVRKSLSGSSDYVYDLYYTRTCNAQEMVSYDWSDVCARFYEPELVHNVIYSEEEECYDDEEDSNDEGNWRNDYPDELSLSEKSLENSSIEDLDHHYRVDSGEDEKSYLDGSYWNQDLEW